MLWSPQPSVEQQDLALLPGQQDIHLSIGDVYFWGGDPAHLATVLTWPASFDSAFSPSSCHSAGASSLPGSQLRIEKALAMVL